MTATKIQPGNDTHLTLLMAPHSLNFVTGADRAALLAYGRDVFAAGREAKCLAQIQGPADMRNALRWAAGGLRAVADDNDTLRIGSETRTVGEVLDAANAALEPAAPALEAPAAPVSTYVEVRECSDCGHVGINDTDGSKAACNTCDWQGDSPREDKCPGCNRVGTMSTACPKCGSRTSLLAETHLLAAAPQAPAAPDPRTPADMLVNGGALKLALNVLRRAGKNEVADELEKTAAPAAPVYPAKFGPDDWIMVVAGIPVKRDEWSPGAVKARTIYGTSAVPAVDASDTALLDAMERHRIALVPEFEGPWDAELYEEGEEPQHIGSGATPREALRAALVTHLQGSGAAISTVRENSAWPMPIPAAQAKKGGA